MRKCTAAAAAVAVDVVVDAHLLLFTHPLTHLISTLLTCCCETRARHELPIHVTDERRKASKQVCDPQELPPATAAATAADGVEALAVQGTREISRQSANSGSRTFPSHDSSRRGDSKRTQERESL